MANKMEMRNACTHMSCQLKTHKICLFIFFFVSYFLCETRKSNNKEINTSRAKNNKLNTQAGQKEWGNITYIEKGIPKWRGENKSFKRRQIESLRRFAVQVIAGYYYGIDVIQTSDDGLTRTDSRLVANLCTNPQIREPKKPALDLNERCNFYDLSPLLL